MTVVSIGSIVSASREICSADELDRLVTDAGYYDKDVDCDDEYVEQLELARSLKVGAPRRGIRRRAS